MTLAWPVVPFSPWWFKSSLEKQRCFNSFHFLSSSVFLSPSFSPALKKPPQNPKYSSSSTRYVWPVHPKVWILVREEDVHFSCGCCSQTGVQGREAGLESLLPGLGGHCVPLWQLTPFQTLTSKQGCGRACRWKRRAFKSPSSTLRVLVQKEAGVIQNSQSTAGAPLTALAIIGFFTVWGMKYQALIVIFPHAAVKNLFVSFTISRGGSFVPFFNKVEMPKVLQFVIALFAQHKTLVAILRLAFLIMNLLLKKSSWFPCTAGSPNVVFQSAPIPRLLTCVSVVLEICIICCDPSKNLGHTLDFKHSLFSILKFLISPKAPHLRMEKNMLFKIVGIKMFY